jgi:hypothetical protein
MIDLNTLDRATRECLERAVRGYIDCALWSETDSETEAPLADRFTADDVSFGSRENMTDDVYAFLSACWYAELDLSALEPEQIGHDLWLTRGGHGVGFWDRGLGDLGERLTEIAHAEGSVHLWVGDNGRVYYGAE